MIQQEIIEAFSAIAREKNIDRTHLGTIIEDLFLAIIQKKYGEEYTNFSVIVNMDKGTIEIYQELTVADEVENPVLEISLEKAREVESDLEVGDPFIVVLDPTDFGRRLISTAKQFLSQKIREIEKQAVFDEYETLVGTIATGDVHQVRRDNVYVNIDRVELRLPRIEQIPGERYRRGSTIRAMIKSVEMTPKGPDIVISRADSSFLIRLFEMEVPEIEDGIIEIKTVARAPGDRSKIVVYSHDKRIDAVGACVGMRGSRIQSIVRELSGEKIDIINWSEQPEILVSRALSPAKPINLLIMEDKSYIMAVFHDDELPAAIGRNGQNISLASEVTGYAIDAVKQSEYEGPKKTEIYLDELRGLSKAQVEVLAGADIHTGVDFIEAEADEILALKGFGAKTREKVLALIERAQADVEDADDESADNGEAEIDINGDKVTIENDSKE